MDKLTVNWLSDCPRCNHSGDHKVESNSANPDVLNEGDVVSCGKCGFSGVIELVESGIVECYWADDSDYYCQCDNNDCGAWFQLGKQGEQCQECGVGNLQPQDVG